MNHDVKNARINKLDSQVESRAPNPVTTKANGRDVTAPIPDYSWGPSAAPQVGDELPELVIAYHESGHAAVDLYFESEIEQITVVYEGDRAGGVLVDRLGDDALKDGDLTDKQVLFERRIMAAMAGEIAQERVAKDNVDPDHAYVDRHIWIEYLDSLDAPELDMQEEEVRKAYVRLLKVRTSALVDHLWPGVERLAQALVERKMLTGEDAEKIFRGKNGPMKD